MQISINVLIRFAGGVYFWVELVRQRENLRALCEACGGAFGDKKRG